jgi:hypothetical protein
MTARVEVLALDVEGTLVSNSVSRIARPGLHDFLEFCRSGFPRVVVYTAVDERRFRDLAGQLVREGSVPAWFAAVPHLEWTGPHKDLALIPGAVVETSLLVDDLEACVHPGQRDRWVCVQPFAPPYSASDVELTRVTTVLAGYRA